MFVARWYMGPRATLMVANKHAVGNYKRRIHDSDRGKRTMLTKCSKSAAPPPALCQSTLDRSSTFPIPTELAKLRTRKPLHYIVMDRRCYYRAAIQCNPPEGDD